VGVGVNVGEGEGVGVLVGVEVGMGVCVGVGIFVGAVVGTGVLVAVGVVVGIGERVGSGVSEGVIEIVGVGLLGPIGIVLHCALPESVVVWPVTGIKFHEYSPSPSVNFNTPHVFVKLNSLFGLLAPIDLRLSPPVPTTNCRTPFGFARDALSWGANRS